MKKDNMNIISGQNVDLLAPFPVGETQRIWGWKMCYRTLSDDDDSPREREEFLAAMSASLPGVCTAGIVDKGQLTSDKHEAPIVGILMFLPEGQRDGQIHFAAGRKAFKMGLVEEALGLFLPGVFEAYPSLLRITARLDEANTPAKGLFKRMGFRFEGVAQSAVMQGGLPRSRVQFGLTRERALIPPMEVSPVVSDVEECAAEPQQEPETYAA